MTSNAKCDPEDESCRIRDGTTTRSNDQMRGWKDDQKNTNGPSEKSRNLEAQHFTEQKSQVCSHSTEIKKSWRREAEKISNGDQNATETGEMNEQSTNMRSMGGGVTITKERQNPMIRRWHAYGSCASYPVVPHGTVAIDCRKIRLPSAGNLEQRLQVINQ